MPGFLSLKQAYLYEVIFPDGDYSRSPDIEEVASKVLSCSRSHATHLDQCNFDASAGIFITGDADLVIYSGAFYRRPPHDLLIGDLVPQPTLVRLAEF